MTNTIPAGAKVEMLGCPFCGADGYLAEIDGYRPSSPKTYQIMCSADDCNIHGLEFDTEVEAIAWWNRRADSAELAKLREQVASRARTVSCSTLQAAGEWEPLSPGVHEYDGGSVIVDEDGFFTRTYPMSMREMVEGESDAPPMPFRLCRRVSSGEGE